MFKNVYYKNIIRKLEKDEDKEKCLILLNEILKDVKQYIFEYTWASFCDCILFERLCKDLSNFKILYRYYYCRFN